MVTPTGQLTRRLLYRLLHRLLQSCFFAWDMADCALHCCFAALLRALILPILVSNAKVTQPITIN
jgi:hypothetical protein